MELRNISVSGEAIRTIQPESRSRYLHQPSFLLCGALWGLLNNGLLSRTDLQEGLGKPKVFVKI